MPDTNKLCIGKRFKVQHIQMDLKQQTEYEKLIDVVSDSTLQLTFKKITLVEFLMQHQKKFPNYLERLLKYPSLFQLCIYVRPDFLHIFK